MELYGSIQSISGSMTASVFTGSFVGDGSGLYGISASGVTGLNLSQISTGSVTASVSPNGFNVNSNTSITGSLRVTGTIVAEQIDVTIYSSSVLYQSGSTRFGDSLDDNHDITGSVNITGSISLNGQAIGTGKLDETVFNSYTASNDPRVSALEVSTSSLNSFSSSINSFTTSLNSYTSSNDTRVGALEVSTGSLNSFTSSIDTTIKNKLNTESVISGSVQVEITGTTGYSTFSSSIATTDLNQSNRLTSIETTTSSLNNFSYSINTIIKDKINLENVVSSSTQISITGTNGYTTFSSSIATTDSLQEGRLSSLETASGSLNTFSSSALSKFTSIETSTSSLNTFTSSANTRLNNLESESGSIRVDFNTYTSSNDSTNTAQNNRLNSIETTTGSLNTFTSSTSTRLSAIETATSSLNSFTSSIDTTIKNKLNTDNVVSGSGQIDITQTSNYTTFSSSLATTDLNQTNKINAIESSTSSLNTYTSSTNTRLGVIENTTSSLNTYTSSTNTRLGVIESTTASLNSHTSSANGRLTSLETASGSIRNDFNTFTSSYTTVSGSLDSRLDVLEAYSSSQQVPTASYALRTTQTDVYCQNNSGYQINKGQVVRIVGAVGDNPLIATASYENDNNSANTLGIATENIANGSNGLVITEGVLLGVNTLGMTAGDLIFLGSTGSFINTSPVAPLHGVRLGEVLRVNQNNGSIYVRIDNGIELNEAHDVAYTNISQGDLLVRNSGGIWTNTKQLNGSYALTGSLTVSGSQNIIGTQTVSGSLIVLQDLQVFGSSSITYVTASQLALSTSFISVNVFEPAERFGGLKVYDSGSLSHQATASLAWDSLNNRWVYQNASGSSYSGGMLISGPRNSGSLGDEPSLTSGKIPKSVGGDHIDNSIMNETSGVIYITGSLSATGTVYGTNITAIETTTSSLNSYTASNDSTNTTQNNRLTSIETSTSSLNSYTSSANTRLGVIESTTSSLNSFTSSTNTRLNSIETSTGSLNTYTSSTNTRLGALETSTSSLNSYTSSNTTNINAIHTATSSLNSYTSSTNTRLGSIETATSSLNSYTASNNTTVTNQNNRLSALETTTSSLNSYTSSNTTNINAIHTATSSLNTFTSSAGSRLTSIETSTGSLNSYTSSTNTRLGLIETSTGSLNSYTSSTNTRLGLIETSTGSLNSFTSSINTTIKNRLSAENVLSSSAQVVSALPSGTVSGSAQISIASTTGFSTYLDQAVKSGSTVTFAGITNTSTYSGSNIIYSTYNTATGRSNLGFSVAKTTIGNIHIQNGSGAGNDNSNQAAITFQGGSSSEAQAGIYVLNNSSYGTSMGFATTNSYSTGPQLFMTATNAGVVDFPRARPTYNGNTILDAANYTSYAMAGAGYSANQNLNTSSAVTFAGVTSTAQITAGYSVTTEPFVNAHFYNTSTTTSTQYGGLLVSGINQAHIRFQVGSNTWGAVGAKQWQIRVGNGGGSDDMRVYSWTYGGDVMTYNSNGTVSVASTLSSVGLTNTGAYSGSGGTFSHNVGNPAGVTELFVHNGANTPVPFRMTKAGYSGAGGSYGILQLYMNDNTNGNGANLYFCANSSNGTFTEYGGIGMQIKSNTAGSATARLYFYRQERGINGTFDSDGTLYTVGNIYTNGNGTTTGNLVLNSSNYTSYAMAGAGYSANQNLNTSSAVTFAGITSNGSLSVSGIGTFTSSSDHQIALVSPDTWAGIQFDDTNSSPDYIWYHGGNQTFAIGGGGSNVSGKKLHVHGGMTIGTSLVSTASPSEGLTVAGVIKGASYFDAQASSGFRIRNSNDSANAGGFTRRGLWEGNANYDPAIWAETGYSLYIYTNGSGTIKAYWDTSGHLLPGQNNTYDLGSSSLGWRNVYTNDLHLSNMNKPEGNDIDGTKGNWTIQEGAENLYIINNNNGKKFKISLEEIK